MRNNKLFAVIAIMLGISGLMNAQDNGSNTQSMAISFGIKGGLNLATVNGDIDSPNYRTSFYAGLSVEFPVAEIFSLQLEALYSGQGAEFEHEGSDGDKAELQLDYINVPLLTKFYLFKGFSVEAGPQFSFLLNDEIDSNPNSNSGDSPTPFRDRLKTFEFGVAGGLTFQTDLGLFATARYIQGVTDIADDMNVQNAVFQVGLGYKF
ncbi:porin family protein [Flavobacterium sp. RNTU_13]|uniref:porin family protein n=1 Tax=Flavobacterium sp. RNTU_13 TaxID=3375145 RepID=UPI003986524C